MGLVLTLDGAQGVMGSLTFAPLLLRLYTQSGPLSPTATADDFDEPGVRGYSPESITFNAWRVSVDGDLTVSTHPEVQFMIDGRVTIRGYFLTRGAVVVWAEAFLEPVEISRVGDIFVTPRVTVRS